MKSLAALSSLEGRVGIITGGAGHVASAAADALAEQGADLILIDRNEKELTARIAAITEKYSVTVHPVVCDFEGGDSFQACIEWVKKEFECIDFILNNAAFVGDRKLPGWCTPFEEQSLETWERCINVNLTIPFFLVQRLVKQLKRSQSASVINIGSIYGKLGPDYRLYQGTEMGNPGAYAASKGGLDQLTRWLTTTLAPEVRVNSIILGGIYRGQDRHFVEQYRQRTPLQRMAVEEDIKGAVLFFASDLSSYVTGQSLAIDGGWMAW